MTTSMMLTLSTLAALVTGCATGEALPALSLGREVNVTPTRGQVEDQVSSDDRECAAWARATKGQNEPLPTAELRYSACMIPKGYRVELSMARISAPADRTQARVVGDMQRCELRRLVDVATSLDPAVRKKALDCFTASGYTVADFASEQRDGSGLPSPTKP
jgi:hypothetical protein